MGSKLSRVVATATVLMSLAGVALGGLVAGDIAIIAVQTDDSISSPEGFAWVPLVNLTGGQQIHFTDNSYSGNNLVNEEGIATFTAPASGIMAGTVLTYRKGQTADIGTYTLSGSFDFSTEGDQVFAFTGTPLAPTFLFAVQTNSSEFQQNRSQTVESELPDDLDVGTTAVAVGKTAASTDEYDNAQYNGILTVGTKEELLAAIGDKDKWTKSNSPFASLATASQFSVQGGVSAVPEPGGLFVGTLVLGISAVIGGVIGARKWRAAT